MRILKIVDGEYPWDVRVEKVALSLNRNGHPVHMVARNRDRRPLREEIPEAVMHRMTPWRWLGTTLDAASQFPAFMNPRWIRLARRVGRRERAQVVLVRDLPLAPTAIWVGRRLGIPVILDMAENYPAMIRDLWTTDSTRFGDALVRNPKAVEAVERWTMARIDHTLVVVEESGERLQAELGVPSERITVVGNTPSLSRLADFAERPAPLVARPATPLKAVYLGVMEEARGVRSVIEAVARLSERDVPVDLTLIGEGRARGDFEALAARLGLPDDRFRSLGFIEYREALRIVGESEVGLIPHLANESWNTTIPNKLFDYMAAGLAVVSSDARPAARVVRETGAGRVFRSGDAEDLARVLEEIWREGSAWEIGQAGRRGIRDRYHWEVDEARLLESVERVGREGRAGAVR